MGNEAVVSLNWMGGYVAPQMEGIFILRIGGNFINIKLLFAKKKIKGASGIQRRYQFGGFFNLHTFLSFNLGEYIQNFVPKIR